MVFLIYWLSSQLRFRLRIIIGAAIGKPIGKVASHAIAWLFMFLAVASTHLALSFWDRPNQFASDLQTCSRDSQFLQFS